MRFTASYMRSAAVVLVILLIAIAVFLAYQIYKTQTTKQAVSKNPTNKPSTTPVAPPLNPQSMLYQFPKQNASKREIDIFLAQLAYVEKETGKIEFTNCQPNPIILKIKNGNSFVVKNLDLTTHKFSFKGHPLSVDASQSAMMTTDWGSGVIGYSCDNSPKGNVGIIHTY